MRRAAGSAAARAFDAGFYGYNRPGGLTGCLPDRVRALGEIIYAPSRLQRAAGIRCIDQCVPVDLAGKPWSRQQQIGHRDPRQPIGSF